MEILTGNTPKIFVTNIKTVDESNSVGVLVSCKLDSVVHLTDLVSLLALSRALALAVARARLTCETSAPAVARKHMVR